MGKGSSAQTVGYKYFVGLHWTFCHGPIDKLIQIRVDKKPIWAGGQSSGAIAINQPDLFGGDGREGGVSGTLDILSGSPTQPKNAYLVGVLGNLVSAYRGFGGLVARQFYIGNNPYLKQWDFLIQRIFLADDGVDQWYKTKAGITSPSSLTISPLTGDTNLPANGSSSAGQTAGEGYDFDCSAGSAIVVGTTPNADAWSYTPSDNYNIGSFPKTWTFRFGIRTPSGAVTTYWPETYLTSAEATAAKADQQISIQATETGTYKLFLYDAEVDDNRGVGHFTIGVGPGLIDMNPAHMIRECLTNQTWGMGYPELDMGDSFTACADTLFGESFGLSLEWKDDSAIEDFVKDIMRYIDAVIQVDRNTGKYELKLIRNDYDISTLLHLNPSNVDKVSDYSFQKFGELISTVSVEWWDCANQTTKLTTVTDGALAAAQENDIAITNKYPGITNPYLANRVAARDLRVNSTPIRSCTVYATTVAKNLKLGDVFLLTWPIYSIVNLPMRITAISYGDGSTNRVRIGCTEDIFGINNDTLVTTTTAGGWVNPKSPPGAATDVVAFEVPYLEAVQRARQSDIDALDPLAGYVGMAASGAPRAINARLWTDAGAGYANAGPVDFCPACRLNAAIDEMATSIVVKNEKNFDQLTPQTWFQCGDELMNFVAYNAATHTITVARGLLDTVPTKHATNSLCLFWDYDNGVDSTEYAAGETVHTKLITANGSGALSLSAATAYEIDVVGRLAKPYPPGNVKLNGDYFPADVAGGFSFEWAHRDRKQQTSGTYIGFTDGNIGPEPGTTYRVEIYDDTTDVLLYSRDGIADNFFNKTPIVGAHPQMRAEIDSVRGGIRSFQKQVIKFAYDATAPALVLKREDPLLGVVAGLRYNGSTVQHPTAPHREIVFPNLAKRSGKWVFEIKFLSPTLTNSDAGFGIGFGEFPTVSPTDGSMVGNYHLFFDLTGYRDYYRNATKYSGVGYPHHTLNDVFTVLLDFDSGAVFTWVNGAHRVDAPEYDVDPLKFYAPMLDVYTNQVADFLFNFEGPFDFPPNSVSGWLPYSSDGGSTGGGDEGDWQLAYHFGDYPTEAKYDPYTKKLVAIIPYRGTGLGSGGIGNALGVYDAETGVRGLGLGAPGAFGDANFRAVEIDADGHVYGIVTNGAYPAQLLKFDQNEMFTTRDYANAIASDFTGMCLRNEHIWCVGSYSGKIFRFNKDNFADNPLSWSLPAGGRTINYDYDNDVFFVFDYAGKANMYDAGTLPPTLIRQFQSANLPARLDPEMRPDQLIGAKIVGNILVAIGFNCHIFRVSDGTLLRTIEAATNEGGFQNGGWGAGAGAIGRYKDRLYVAGSGNNAVQFIDDTGATVEVYSHDDALVAGDFYVPPIFHVVPRLALFDGTRYIGWDNTSYASRATVDCSPASDGLKFDRRRFAVPGPIPAGDSSLCIGGGVYVSTRGTALRLRSTDLINWELFTHPAGWVQGAPVWDGSRFVMLGTGTGFSTHAWASPDGASIEWTDLGEARPTGSGVSHIYLLNGVFYFIDYTADIYSLYRSTDAVTWSRIASTILPVNPDPGTRGRQWSIVGIAYNGSSLVIIGGQIDGAGTKPLFLRSTDNGLTFADATPAFSNKDIPFALTVLGTKFIAAKGDGLIASDDGFTWSETLALFGDAHITLGYPLLAGTTYLIGALQRTVSVDLGGGSFSISYVDVGTFRTTDGVTVEIRGEPPAFVEGILISDQQGIVQGGYYAPVTHKYIRTGNPLLLENGTALTTEAGEAFSLDT